MGRRLKLCAVLTAAVLGLSGCALRGGEREAVREVTLPEPTRETQDMILGEQRAQQSTDVALYFAAPDGAGFSTITQNLTAESDAGLLEAAVNALLTASPGGESMSLPGGDTRLLACEYACGIATVNLSIDARSVQSAQELLALQAAIGNTLLGIEGVQGVNVLIGGQSESFWQLPTGVQTETIASVTASYAQFQAERERLAVEDGMPVSRKAALYFPSTQGGWLVSELRDVVFSSEDFAGPLIAALQAGPREADCAVPSIPEGVELLEGGPVTRTLSTGERVLSIDFSSALANYLAFSGLEVWELVGSVALTACSFLPEIDAVRILVNGEPITICETDDGILRFPDGLIRRQDFARRIGSVATFYLEDAEGRLQPVKKAVSTRSAYSPRSLLTELFGFAGVDGMNLPVSRNLYSEDLLGVRVEGGIARVNLSAGFYRACQTLDARSERNLIYAMVNTLCQLEDIRAVRFYIEGLAADTLAGNVYLKSPLLPNPGVDADAPALEATSSP